ncbi:MAG: hypothetical protein MUO40_09785 [Anaerolineaceae bacterium]|nr:hypothetical protein [Anaerolineaceae bacterium]
MNEISVVLSKITATRDGTLLIYYDCMFCKKGWHQHGGGDIKTIKDWSKEISFGDRCTHCLAHRDKYYRKRGVNVPDEQIHVADLKYVPFVTDISTLHKL